MQQRDRSSNSLTKVSHSRTVANKPRQAFHAVCITVLFFFWCVLALLLLLLFLWWCFCLFVCLFFVVFLLQSFTYSGLFFFFWDFVNQHPFLFLKRWFSSIIHFSNNIRNNEGCPRGVMVKAMDCGIVIREFVHQSRYHFHFRANTFGKGINPLILPAMG